MAHTLRGNFGRHSGFHHNAHPGGWWKFALVVLLTTAVGVTFIYSPLLRGSGRARGPVPAAPVTVGPAGPVAGESVTAPAQISPPSLAVGPAQSVPAPAVVDDAIQPTIPAAAADVQAGQEIRKVDFAALPILQTLARQLGGRIDNTGIIYADLTADGHEDVVVPITSDGTLGNLAFVVYTLSAGSPQTILIRLAGRERRGLVVTLDRGQLSETSGVYGPFDPNCCPDQIVRTYFRWDGQNLVIDRTNTITIPQGKQGD
jgi:hypothetical protein